MRTVAAKSQFRSVSSAVAVKPANHYQAADSTAQT